MNSSITQYKLCMNEELFWWQKQLLMVETRKLFFNHVIVVKKKTFRDIFEVDEDVQLKWSLIPSFDLVMSSIITRQNPIFSFDLHLDVEFDIRRNSASNNSIASYFNTTNPLWCTMFYSIAIIFEGLQPGNFQFVCIYIYTFMGIINGTGQRPSKQSYYLNWQRN